MYILGINAVYHDPTACLVKDRQVIAAAEEERFTHIKHGKHPNPVAPVVLEEEAPNWFVMSAGDGSRNADASPFMFFVSHIPQFHPERR